MSTFITFLHVIVTICIIFLVIIQNSKSDATAFLGGSTSSNIFGGKGPLNFITKTTVVLTIIFFITSGSLAIIQSDKASSLVQRTRFPEPISSRPINAGPESGPNQVPSNNLPIQKQEEKVSGNTQGNIANEKSDNKPITVTPIQVNPQEQK